MARASPQWRSRYHAKLKAKYIELLGAQCFRCKSREHLEFDHIDPAAKSFTITDRLDNREEIVIKELEKVQLLCRSCHHQKHHTGKRTHGTLSSYRYCRCDACREAKANYMKTYRRP